MSDLSDNQHVLSATKATTFGVADLAALPDPTSPVGSCPVLPLRWHERDSGACRIPPLSQMSAQVRPPLVRRIDGAGSNLVVAGHEALTLARTHALAEISVRWCDCPMDVAVLIAAHELLHDPRLHRSTDAARDLARYMQWLTRQATIASEEGKYRIGPVVNRLFDNPGRRGVYQTISAITGYSTRALRARDTRALKRSDTPALPVQHARTLIRGEVRRVIDPGALRKSRRSSDQQRPHQYELHLVSGGPR